MWRREEDDRHLWKLISVQNKGNNSTINNNVGLIVGLLHYPGRWLVYCPSRKILNCAMTTTCWNLNMNPRSMDALYLAMFWLWWWQMRITEQYYTVLDVKNNSLLLFTHCTRFSCCIKFIQEENYIKSMGSQLVATTEQTAFSSSVCKRYHIAAFRKM
jgi:hypothetical protein